MDFPSTPENVLIAEWRDALGLEDSDTAREWLACARGNGDAVNDAGMLNLNVPDLEIAYFVFS